MAKIHSLSTLRSGEASAKFPIAILIVSLISGTAIGFFAGGGTKGSSSTPKVVAGAEPEVMPGVAALTSKPLVTTPAVNQQTVAPVMVLPPIEKAPPAEVTKAPAIAMKQPEIQPAAPQKEPEEPMPEARVVTFKEHVMPVFQARCIECHGDPTIKSGFDMRTLAKINTGGNGGPGLVAGKPEMSYLFERIEDGSMPPRGKSPLSKSEMNLIREWIANGAK